MTIPKIKLTTLFPWLLLIAAILLLAYCNNRSDKLRQVWQARAEMADSLRKDAGEDRLRLARKNAEYEQAMDQKAQEAQIAKKKSDSISKVGKAQAAEIRSLYAELGKPWPVDTVELASKCCEVAAQLADNYESLLIVDSLKDRANMQQIDLATIQVDTLNQALKREQKRYDKLDSINKRYQIDTKLKGSLWGGLRAAVGPVSSAGAYLKWQTGGGKEYGAGVGRMAGGWYGEVSIGTKFSLKKIR